MKAQSFSQKSLATVVETFPFLKEYVGCQELENEWRHHALMDHKNLNLDPSQPAEHYWTTVFNLRNNADLLLFPNLKVVIKFLLILPFSNASVEWIFSDLDVIKTDERNKLDTPKIISLLHTKEGIKEAGGLLKFEPTADMFKPIYGKE